MNFVDDKLNVPEPRVNVDSNAEFNKRIAQNKGLDNDVYKLRQEIVELETRFLSLEAKFGNFDLLVKKQCEHIEDVINLYRQNVSILDRVIEEYKTKKFMLVEHSGD